MIIGVFFIVSFSEFSSLVFDGSSVYLRCGFILLGDFRNGVLEFFYIFFVFIF